MRHFRALLVVPVAILFLSATAPGATITVGHYIVLPNTPGQTIVINVSGIVPNASANPLSAAPGNVNGMVFSVAIAGGGPAYGGTPGPTITAIDVDSGPSIWVAPNSPAGHNPPSTFYDGQIAQVTFLTVSGFVNVTDGILATLVIDTTGFPAGGGFGEWTLTLAGGAIEENLGDTEFTGSSTPDPVNIVYEAFGGTAGRIAVVPEPSSIVLGLLALAALAAVAAGKRHAR